MSKSEIRQRAYARRRAQPDKDRHSRTILQRLARLPEYAGSHTVLFYVDTRSEVRTKPLLATALASSKRIVVPYCQADSLALFHLESLDELTPGTMGILEPTTALRSEASRHVQPTDLDLIVAPGVAFDRRGARLGQGGGYYDRLLPLVRSDAPIVALAFECQMVDRVPTDPHDVFMDKIVTEVAVYHGRGR